MKLLIIIISVAVIVGGVYMYVASTDVNEGGQEAAQEEGVPQEITSTLRGEEKDFEVRDQEIGDIVIVRSATLPSAGFVVVYEDAGERPGGIVAQTEFMTHGEYKDIEIPVLEDATEKGKKYFVMINIDNGDQKFNAGEDFPTTDESGGSIMKSFVAN